METKYALIDMIAVLIVIATTLPKGLPRGHAEIIDEGN
jgi:hypothetical protein